MVKEHPCVTKAAPPFLALATSAAATTVVVLFLWSPVSGAAAAEQHQRVVSGNTTSYNVDGNFRIAHSQPQLEGFDKMASDLGSALAVLGQLATLKVGEVSKAAQVPGKAACGRDKSGRYIPCTTDPYKGNLRKCDPYNRECK